jgi:hypothetical protein
VVSPVPSGDRNGKTPAESRFHRLRIRPPTAAWTSAVNAKLSTIECVRSWRKPIEQFPTNPQTCRIELISPNVAPAAVLLTGPSTRHQSKSSRR